MKCIFCGFRFKRCDFGSSCFNCGYLLLVSDYSSNNKLDKTEKRCLLCESTAKWYEWSPDGKTDFFCSKRCYRINNLYWHTKGFVWRELPLTKLNKTNN